MPPEEVYSELPSPIVLYDGGCALCSQTVRWLLKRDLEGRLYYASLQSGTAARLREQFANIPEGRDTVVFVELDQSPARISLRSHAVFRVSSYLNAPWRFLAWLRYFPPPLTDLVYRCIAATRHHLGRGLGPVAAPSDQVRARFLD